MKKFLRFVNLDYEKLKPNVSNSSTIEFNKCLEICKSQRIKIKNSEIDKLLYANSLNNLNIEIFALSPSTLSSQNFDNQIATLITDYGKSNKRIPKQSANDRSVVILLKLGYHNILLGSDLEVNKNPELGWLDIINNSQIIKITNKSKYFKIPHHGSENGFHKEIWNKLIETNPISTITPWNRGNKLPNSDMVSKYLKLSDELYITSHYNLSNKPKKRLNKIAKTINQFNNSLQEVEYTKGIISSSIDIADKNAKWKTNLYGASFLITD